MVKKAKRATVNHQSGEREVIYPDLRAEFLLGEDALTSNRAKELLGWETEEDYSARMRRENPELPDDSAQASFGSDFLLTDEYGNKVRCSKDAKNRPFYPGHCGALQQDILSRNWADSRNSKEGEDITINGESIIIGRYGDVLSGQHRLIALVLACQVWAGSEEKQVQAEHWKQNWPEEPTIECLLVTGVDESARVTRTLDNVRPRSLSDVLYTDPDMFGTVGPEQRRILCRMLSQAVSVLWDRTAAKDDPYAPRKTHSEALEFIDRHPKVKEAIALIYDENKDGHVNRFLSGGYAAGVFYLMAASATDTDDYTAGGDNPVADRSEKGINFDNWERAREFWQQIHNNTPELYHVRTCTRPQPGDMMGQKDSALMFSEKKGGSREEKYAALSRGWGLFLQGMPITEEGMTLKYTRKYDAASEVLLDCDLESGSLAYFGGIDILPVIKEKKSPGDKNIPPETEQESTKEEIQSEHPEAIEDETPEQERERRERVTGKFATEKKTIPPGRTPLIRLDEE